MLRYIPTLRRNYIMEVAKVFTNGGSQAVRLPKNCRFDDTEVIANKIGEVVVLIPKDNFWSSAK